MLLIKEKPRQILTICDPNKTLIQNRVKKTSIKRLSVLWIYRIVKNKQIIKSFKIINAAPFIINIFFEILDDFIW